MDDKITILGMAMDRGDANNIVMDIIQGMCDAGVDFDIRGYLGI